MEGGQDAEAVVHDDCGAGGVGVDFGVWCGEWFPTSWNTRYLEVRLRREREREKMLTPGSFQVYASVLPPGVGERVWVVTQVGAEVVVYEGELGTAGLRGAMIGWNDGVFQGWGNTYFGSWDGSS